MTSETLGSIVGVLLSLGFSYIPGLQTYFDGLSREAKQATMGVVLVVAAVGVFALSCFNVLDSVSCTKDGAFGLVKVLIAALVANQGTYLLTRKGHG